MLSFFAACSVECELILESQRVLESAHPEISSAMHEQLVNLGVRLISGAEIVSACTQGERVKIEFSDASSHETPMLLLACGRVANIPKIEFDSIETDERGIVCDEYFESTLASHYAVGDCNGRAASAHAARAQVLNVVDRVAGRRVERIRQTDITNFIRTLPCSYASVGDIRSGFERRGVDFREALTRLGGTPYSFMHAARNAMVVIYADEDSFISGAEIFAPGAEESIYSLSMALAAETDARLAGRTIAAHPTFSEFVERTFKRLR
jgi:dihydrolipoamide dehydrogenase